MSRPKQPERRELWRHRIAQQQASGQSIRVFCREQKLHEHSFYAWRKQLEEAKAKNIKPTVGFALVQAATATAPRQTSKVEPLELILASGDRLLIPANPTTLRLVLDALHEKRP